MKCSMYALALCHVGCAFAHELKIRGNAETRNNAVAKDIVELNTDGVCWELEDGMLCMQGNSLRSVSKVKGTAFYTDFIDGKKYSYQMTDVEQLRSDYITATSSSNAKIGVNTNAALLDNTEWLRALQNSKTFCKVNDGMEFDASNKSLLKAHGDGSSMWQLGNWIIDVDQYGIPFTISSSEDGTDTNPFMFISGVNTNFPNIDGCDPAVESSHTDDDAEKASNDMADKVLQAHYLDTEMDQMDAGELAEGRRLGWGFTNTQWCGAGTDIRTTPCPDPDKDFDYFADRACRRHDHSKCYTFTLGLPIFECEMDYDVWQSTDSGWVREQYSSTGLASITGCWEYSTYLCLKGWSFGYHCEDWKKSRGPGRYSGNPARMGYMDPPTKCDMDLTFHGGHGWECESWMESE